MVHMYSCCVLTKYERCVCVTLYGVDVQEFVANMVALTNVSMDIRQTNTGVRYVCVNNIPGTPLKSSRSKSRCRQIYADRDVYHA